MSAGEPPGTAGYFERLSVPRWSHAMAISLGIIIGGESSFLAVKLPLQGLVILIFAIGAEWIVWGFGRVVIEVRDGYLRADDWRLPVSQIRAVAMLDRAETKTELRRRDDEVYRVTRGWIGPSLLLDVDDPDDLPLWLLSTRHPQELAAALADAAVAQLEYAYRATDADTDTNDRTDRPAAGPTDVVDSVVGPEAGGSGVAAQPAQPGRAGGDSGQRPV